MRTYSPAAAVLNLLLGLPAVVPVWLLWYFASNWPLAALGWTSREPTENDGVLPLLAILIPVVGAFGVLWWLANAAVRRRTAPGGRGRVYWPVSLVLLLVPTLVLIVVL
ncbi:hypothetical protein PUR71_37915 [Streptomyces sp. SP17BM10]|uniref:hypothetical protein n=1 Tax=Streptomyces sp. SP17BM10 TaxID=3002530 RepID=UPI002E75A749|nr:hypothetical protein [Streptomyces sp. SP17BM10]MEE1788639.1 hypothetical protein [Streptomyces sp. SP17BM10]